MRDWPPTGAIAYAEAMAQPPDLPECEVQTVLQALRRGECPVDADFDRFLPASLRAVSSEYWTPLRVAVRVATWLERYAIESVLDIGAGPGKFCVAAAAVHRGACRFIGLEQRSELVAAARELARRCGLDARVRFVEGSLDSPDLPSVHAYYLYNPFGENLVSPGDRLDDRAELTEERYARDVLRVVTLLDAAPVGTYVITYNGFGTPPPAAYRRLQAERDLPYELDLWRKQPRTAPS